MLTVRQFVDQTYQLISASSPTVPLHGSDLSLGIAVLNQLLQSYAGPGLLLTISRTESTTLAIGQQEVICGPADYVPTPEITVGRLANLQSAWLLLNGVTYPLIVYSRNEFLAAWKYDPLQSLPRFVMVFAENEIVRLRIYPAPSQVFEFFIRGKFQLTELTSNDDMAIVPQYYHRYLMFASAKDIAMYKGRADAWTPKLEEMLQEAQKYMISASEVNLSITGERDSLLNGAWAIRAGVS
jgi:hypothetical protein